MEPETRASLMVRLRDPRDQRVNSRHSTGLCGGICWVGVDGWASFDFC